MDLTFLSTNQEEMVLVGVEIEAHTASETVGEGLLLVVQQFLVLIDHQLELNDLLSLKFVFHEVPVGHAAVRRNGVEVEVLAGLFWLPAYLPDGISVLDSADS